MFKLTMYFEPGTIEVESKDWSWVKAQIEANLKKLNKVVIEVE